VERWSDRSPVGSVRRSITLDRVVISGRGAPIKNNPATYRYAISDAIAASGKFILTVGELVLVGTDGFQVKLAYRFGQTALLAREASAHKPPCRREIEDMGGDDGAPTHTAQRTSTTSSTLPSGSRSQNIGGTGSPMRLTSASTSTPAALS
jgi:hypothetical protein